MSSGEWILIAAHRCPAVLRNIRIFLWLQVTGCRSQLFLMVFLGITHTCIFSGWICNELKGFDSEESGSVATG